MRLSRVLVVCTLLVGLTGCTPPVPAPSSAPPTPPAVPTPTPTETADPAPAPTLAEDVLMVVTATATADNGAVMLLTETVHRSLAWNDPASSELPGMMISACGGGVDTSLFEANLWTFARVDVTAVLQPGAPWPANRRIFVDPQATYLDVASTGFPADDDEDSADVPNCRRSKTIDGPGTGYLSVGFAGDSDEVGAAAQFTKWANHNYGFVGIRVGGQTAASAGITLSNCSATVTDAGTALHGNATWWSSNVQDTRCVFGSMQEDTDF